MAIIHRGKFAKGNYMYLCTFTYNLGFWWERVIVTDIRGTWSWDMAVRGATYLNSVVPSSLAVGLAIA